jgi:hypothetical protein
LARSSSALHHRHNHVLVSCRCRSSVSHRHNAIFSSDIAHKLSVSVCSRHLRLLAPPHSVLQMCATAANCSDPGPVCPPKRSPWAIQKIQKTCWAKFSCKSQYQMSSWAGPTRAPRYCRDKEGEKQKARCARQESKTTRKLSASTAVSVSGVRRQLRSADLDG